MHGKSLLTFVCVLLTAALATAQETTTGSIAGRVVDSQGLAVPGATVTVIAPQGPRTFTTAVDGRFFAPFLPPGQYEVKVELQGFRPLDRQNIDVRLGQRVELTFPLQLGALTESVDVTSAAPPIDRHSSTTTGAVIDSDMLERAPGRPPLQRHALHRARREQRRPGRSKPTRRSPAAAASRTTTSSTASTSPTPATARSGRTRSSSDRSATACRSTSSRRRRSRPAATKPSSASPPAASSTSSPRAARTSCAAAVFGYFRPEGLESSYNQVTTVNGTVNIDGHARRATSASKSAGRWCRTSCSSSAPIDPQWQRTTYIAPEGFPLRSLGGVDQDRRITAYAAKGTWQIGAGQRLDASFFGDPANGDNGPQRYTALLRTDTSGFSELDQYGGHNQTVTLRRRAHADAGWSKRPFARAENSIVEVPSVDQWSVTDNTVTPQHPQRRHRLLRGRQPRRRTGSTRRRRPMCSHEHQHALRPRIRRTSTTPTPSIAPARRSRCPTARRRRPAPRSTSIRIRHFGQIYRVVRANTSNVPRHARSTTSTLFAQDTWTVGDRLTIKPGIRYEQQKLTGTLADLTLGNNWAPRIGATYDSDRQGHDEDLRQLGPVLLEDPERSRGARAVVGRRRQPRRLLRRRPDAADARRRRSRSARRATSCSRASAADLIDPNLEVELRQRSRRRLRVRSRCRGMNVGVRYIHRDIPRVLEDVQPFPIVAGDLGVPGATTADYTLTNPGPDTPTAGDLGASFEKPIHNYNAVELTADKRLREPLVAAGVVSLLAPARHVRGLLPRRQRPVGSGHHVALRLPDQRSELHGDRRAAVRLSRRHPLPRRAWCGPAAARSAAPGQGLRHATASRWRSTSASACHSRRASR